ncbi:MAG TPA: DUF732 domain-containing protein [Mycobacterium sp.]|nr:DUF732 domain-containing protein [Mycobacterium sp.]HQC75441.1 DUF732 domain-containing protein [Mycobacterium sp.]
MTTSRRILAAAVSAVAAVTLAAPAQADPDIDFANQLHGYGIYGQRDYNAWLAKIACKRLATGVDGEAYASETFVSRNLARTTTQSQAWQFLGAAISIYCPEQTVVLQAAAR